MLLYLSAYIADVCSSEWFSHQAVAAGLGGRTTVYYIVYVELICDDHFLACERCGSNKSEWWLGYTAESAASWCNDIVCLREAWMWAAILYIKCQRWLNRIIVQCNYTIDMPSKCPLLYTLSWSKSLYVSEGVMMIFISNYL